MKKYIVAALGSTVVLASACSDNPAAPSRDNIVAGSQQTLQSLVTGITATDRAVMAAGNGYWIFGSVMARDIIVPTINESRWVTEFYATQPDPSDFIGGADWTTYYQMLRASQNLLKDPAVTTLSTAGQSVTRGFLRTLDAQTYIREVEMRDQNGAVIQGPDPTKQDPVRTKQAVLTYVSALLDSALVDLNAGSASLPFSLPSGYSLHGDYSQTANLILFNRGLKGKAEVMRALDNGATPNLPHAAAAITALDSALAGEPTPVTEQFLNIGPWYQYNPSAPESRPNPLSTAVTSNYVTDNFVNSFMAGDIRAANIIPATKATVDGFTGSNRLKITDPTNSALQSAPLPMMRNAELILLRAQAEIATGDLAGATRDINATHTVEGGLAPYATFTSSAAAIQALLYELRYTFATIGPQHMDALREYGMFNLAYVTQPGIPSPGASDALVSQLPIPQNESNARGGNVTPQP
ncbi:MAG: hypothetical protein M3R65_06405 [Gemmatimonadota bacterium]|nr:hypothetical protein [Gemmatimonadota bacterium]